MNNEYLSIKDFAHRAGITPQAVYKQLDNKLKPFVKLTNGKKTLQIEALALFENNNLNSVGCSTNNNSLNPEIQLIIDLLKGQLAEKDHQLEVKDRQLEAKDKQIETLNERLKEAQKLVDQEQQLHAGTKQLLLEAPKRHWWNIGKRKKTYEAEGTN